MDGSVFQHNHAWADIALGQGVAQEGKQVFALPGTAFVEAEEPDGFGQELFCVASSAWAWITASGSCQWLRTYWMRM